MTTSAVRYELIDDALVLPQLVASRAERDGARPFLQHVDGEVQSYAEVHAQALRWGGAFTKLGVAAREPVLTLLPPDLDNVPIWLGLAWIGAIDTGINTDYRGRMLAYVLENSGAKVVVTTPALLERLEEIAGDLASPPTVVVLDGEAPSPGAVQVVGSAGLLDAVDPLVPGPGPRPWDIACMLYTSGTTGPSKGVLIPWAQIHATSVLVFPPEDFADDESYYSPFAMCHMSGRMPPYVMALCGGRVVVRDHISLTHFVDDLEAFTVTTALLNGAITSQLMQRAPSTRDAEHPLRRLMAGPVPPHINDFADRFGVKVSTAFNMTEICPATWVGYRIEDHLSCGRPVEGYPGMELRIVDEHDIEVPVGEVGELAVRTQVPWTLNAGYFGDPAKTADAWRNGWFHTGDAFRRDASDNYFFVDRIKDCIRRRGENISSFEVELHVNEHPAIAESAAVAADDAFSGHEVRVFVVPRPGVVVDPADLVAFLQPRMPKFMVPRYIDIVEDLPRTAATLKVRKVELRARPLAESTYDRQAGGPVAR